MPLLFLDLETTGLDPKNDDVLEVAAVVMSDDLETEIARYGSVIAWDASKHTRPIDPFVVAMHTKNNLWVECLAAVRTPVHRPGHDLSRAAVNARLRDFIVANGCGGGERSGAQLAGNSIHFDRAFMREYLPLSLAELHYRQLDVTSINELARRVWPDVFAGRPSAPPVHRALPDVEHSIETARYYARALGSFSVNTKVVL